MPWISTEISKHAITSYRAWPWKWQYTRTTCEELPHLDYPNSNQTWPEIIENNWWNASRKEKPRLMSGTSLVTHSVRIGFRGSGLVLLRVAWSRVTLDGLFPRFYLRGAQGVGCCLTRGIARTCLARIGICEAHRCHTWIWTTVLPKPMAYVGALKQASKYEVLKLIYSFLPALAIP